MNRAADLIGRRALREGTARWDGWRKTGDERKAVGGKPLRWQQKARVQMRLAEAREGAPSRQRVGKKSSGSGRNSRNQRSVRRSEKKQTSNRKRRNTKARRTDNNN